MTAADIDAIFKAVGSLYGFDDVGACFDELADFNIRWQRSFSWACFRVSDYLEGAPEEVIYMLADTIFSKIKGKDSALMPEFIAYVRAPGFVADHQ